MANGLRINCRKNTSKSFYSPTLKKQEEDFIRRRESGDTKKYGPPENY